MVLVWRSEHTEKHLSAFSLLVFWYLLSHTALSSSHASCTEEGTEHSTHDEKYQDTTSTQVLAKSRSALGGVPRERTTSTGIGLILQAAFMKGLAATVAGAFSATAALSASTIL